MYQSNVSSLHKFKLQEELAKEIESKNFPRYSEDWGGCHGHSGQRTEGRLGGATKNGGRGQGWIGVGRRRAKQSMGASEISGE